MQKESQKGNRTFKIATKHLKIQRDLQNGNKTFKILIELLILILNLYKKR